MKQIGSCPICQSLVIGFTNAMQTEFDDIFSALGLSSRATPKATWKRYMGHCVYCGQETDWNLRGCSNVKNSPEIDHWIPISLGGPPSVWNMLLACKSCNSSKGDTLWPYPPALLDNVPGLEKCTIAAKELATLAWGDIVSTDTKGWIYCEVMNYISKRWQAGALTFGSRFPKLSGYMNDWQPNHCRSISHKEASRLVVVLERETERELYG